MAFLQVILRNLLDQGIVWGDTFLRHLVLWVGFIGASLATREEKHINIDLFSRFFKNKSKNIIQVITYAFSAFVCYILMSAAWNFVMEEREFETIIFNDIPAWYFQIIIPVGFGLMALRFVFSIIDKLEEIFKPKPGESK